MNTKILAMVSALLVIAAIGSANANPTTPTAAVSPKRDVFATLASTKTTLDSAIQTAEHTVTGTLLKAGVDNETTPVAYKVAIADSNSRTVTYFKIDSVTGKVLDSRTLHPGKQSVKTPAAKAPAATAPATPMTGVTTPATNP